MCEKKAIDQSVTESMNESMRMQCPACHAPSVLVFECNKCHEIRCQSVSCTGVGSIVDNVIFRPSIPKIQDGSAATTSRSVKKGGKGSASLDQVCVTCREGKYETYRKDDDKIIRRR